MTIPLGGWRRIVRFYQAAVLNTAFGFGLYAALVAAGLDRYVAQALAHVLGASFNFLTYSRHTFPDASASRSAGLRFALSYVLNYLASLIVLAGVSQLWASPYGAGLVTILIVSLLNFLVLRGFVFRVAR